MGTNIITNWPHSNMVGNLNADMLDGYHATNLPYMGTNYQFVEQDPQVGEIAPNYVPHWIGTSLVTGTIFDNGNIGIGTTNPSSRLHIGQSSNDRDGGLYIQRAGTPYGAVMYVDGGGDVRIGTKSDDPAFPYDADYITLATGNGNVGIGTVNPGYKLQVNGGDLVKSTTIGWDNTWDNVIKYITQQDTSAHPNRWIGADATITAGGAGANKLKFRIYQGAAAPDQPPLDVMTLQGDGKVGIGPTSPSDRLHLYSGPAAAWGTAGGITISDSHPAVRLWDSAGGDDVGTLDLQSGPSRTVRIIARGDSFFNAGNVGIGTPSPGSKLTVQTAGAQHAFVSIKTDGTVGYVAAATFQRGSGSYWEIGSGVGPADNEFGVYSGDAGARVFTIKSGGNVGIGMDVNPSSRLHIRQSLNDRDGGLYIQRAGTDYGAVMYMDSGGGVRIGTRSDPGADYDTDYIFLAGGNVGIGISPAYKLDVNGNAMIRGVLKISTGDNRIEGGTSGWYQRPFLALSAQAPAYNYDLVTTLVPQNVGLYVAEHRNRWPNIHVKDDGRLYVRMYVEEGSDGRTKFDQQPLDYGLAQVMAVHPTRYKQAEWEHDKETGKIIIHPERTRNDIGVVAQQLRKIIPEAVNVPEDEVKQTWSIAYSKLIPVLINAIQEQQKQIEKLEDKIERLEKKIRDK